MPTHYINLTLCQICIILFGAYPQSETASGSIIMQNSWMKLFPLKGKQKHRDYFRGIFLMGKLERWSSKNMVLLFFFFFKLLWPNC